MKILNLEITENEAKALKIVLYSEYKIYRDRVGHAASHGDEYADDYGQKIESALAKIESALNNGDG